MTCSLTATTRSVSLAALASPKARAAVLLVPTISAIVKVSPRMSARELDRS